MKYTDENKIKVYNIPENRRARVRMGGFFLKKKLILFGGIR